MGDRRKCAAEGSILESFFSCEEGWIPGRVTGRRIEPEQRAARTVRNDRRHADSARDRIVRNPARCQYPIDRVAQTVAAMATTLGGIDGLAFSDGVVAHSAATRIAVACALNGVGLRTDPGANAAQCQRIDASASGVNLILRDTCEDREPALASRIAGRSAESGMPRYFPRARRKKGTIS